MEDLFSKTRRNDMKHPIADYKQTAIQAAWKASEALLKGFNTIYKISSKPGKHNLVTEYDMISEKIILDTIHAIYPDHNILTEESGSFLQQSEVTWIIDPLDGTVNFAHGIPIFCISIAVAIGEEVVIGVVYQPIVKELFVAEKNKGATLNDKPIYVSKTSSIDEAILATGFPYNVQENPLNCINQISFALQRGLPIRRLGSAAIDLCYTAAGKFDGYWEASLQAWDLAAGQLIIEEAGGKVTNYSEEKIPFSTKTSVVASNSLLHQTLIELLRINP
jgi:myo-inositol-1(or 4)-monophosphatase